MIYKITKIICRTNINPLFIRQEIIPFARLDFELFFAKHLLYIYLLHIYLLHASTVSNFQQQQLIFKQFIILDMQTLFAMTSFVWNSYFCVHLFL